MIWIALLAAFASGAIVGRYVWFWGEIKPE
jgi:hypothetical protein